MKTKTILLAALAAGFTLSVPAQAHRAWLLPSTTVLSDTTQAVTVDAGASTDPFTPDHAAMPTDDIKVWAPDGSMGKIENAARGRYRSTFDVMIDKPGTWRIGTESSGLTGTFTVDGEQWMVGRRRGARPGGPPPAAEQRPAAPAPAQGDEGEEGARPRQTIDPAHIVASADEIPAGAANLELTQTLNRNIFFVTAGEPTEGAYAPTNTGLEMVPLTPPTDLVSDEPGSLRFLVDGKPAAGLKVTVIPGGQRFRDAEHGQELTTDADGTVAVSWPVPGFYWINASLTDDKPGDSRANRRRMGYTATLEVAAP